MTPVRWMRTKLRRHDGAVHLERWGIETPLGGAYLHRMDAADPSLDLHDHEHTYDHVVRADRRDLWNEPAT